MTKFIYSALDFESPTQLLSAAAFFMLAAMYTPIYRDIFSRDLEIEIHTGVFFASAFACLFLGFILVIFGRRNKEEDENENEKEEKRK